MLQHMSTGFEYSLFVGREDPMARFVSRCEHYRLFIYEGLPGIGKSTLVAHLSEQALAMGSGKVIYLPVSKGESVLSLLVRTKARLLGPGAAFETTPSDVYVRLLDLLCQHRAVLVLDDMDHLAAEDISRLTRLFATSHQKDFRVIATTSTPVSLPALEMPFLYYERLGALSMEAVVRACDSWGISDPIRGALVADASRGGSAGHPLTLKLLACGYADAQNLTGGSARSVLMCKQLLASYVADLCDEGRAALELLAYVRVPVGLIEAKAWCGDAPVEELLCSGVLQLLDGEVSVHALVDVVAPELLPVKKSRASGIAKYLCERSVLYGEVLGLIRASEVLAGVHESTKALDILDDAMAQVCAMGHQHALLMSLKSMPISDEIAFRVRVLSAAARMDTAQGRSLRDELEMLSSCGDVWAEIRALQCLIVLLDGGSDDKQVLVAFDLLQSKTKDPSFIVPSAHRAVMAMARQERVSDAEKLALQLLQHLQDNKQTSRLAEIHQLIGDLQNRSSRFTDAVISFQKAVAAYQDEGQVQATVQATVLLGDVQRNTGNFSDALLSYQRAREQAEVLSDRDLAWRIDANIVWNHFLSGNLLQAEKTLGVLEAQHHVGANSRLRRMMQALRCAVDVYLHEDMEKLPLLAELALYFESEGNSHLSDVLAMLFVELTTKQGNYDEAKSFLASRIIDEKKSPLGAAYLLRSWSVLEHALGGDDDVASSNKKIAQARKLFVRTEHKQEESRTLLLMARWSCEAGDDKNAIRHAQAALDISTSCSASNIAAYAQAILAVALLSSGELRQSIALLKLAMPALRQLGLKRDVVRVGIQLLSVFIAHGDLNSALKLGLRLREDAERLALRDERLQVIILCGVVLLHRGRLDAASKCFREIPSRGMAVWTYLLMWRFGEALAWMAGDYGVVAGRRKQWIQMLVAQDESTQKSMTARLQQLNMPPWHAMVMRDASGESCDSIARLAVCGLGEASVILDIASQTIQDHESIVAMKLSFAATRIWSLLAMRAPHVVSSKELAMALLGEETQLTDKIQKSIDVAVREIEKALNGLKNVTVLSTKTGVKLVIGVRNYAVLAPFWDASDNFDDSQKKLLTYMAHHCPSSIETLQSACEIEPKELKKHLKSLIDAGRAGSSREGKLIVYQLLA